MAKINEQTLIITVSQLVKDDSPTQALLNDEVVAQLEAVVAELAGAGTLVEIKQA
jgi:hypothetical protein